MLAILVVSTVDKYHVSFEGDNSHGDMSHWDEGGDQKRLVIKSIAVLAGHSSRKINAFYLRIKVGGAGRKSAKV